LIFCLKNGLFNLYGTSRAGKEDNRSNWMSRLKAAIILAGDILIFYGSLMLTLFFRFGQDDFRGALFDHIVPFSFILIFWIFIFYLADLYQMRALKDRQVLVRSFFPAIITSTLISIVVFYVFGSLLKISPKLNLLLLAVIFTFLDYSWRSFLIKRFKGWQTNILIFGDSAAGEETESFLKNNPQLGYRPKIWKKRLEKDDFHTFSDFIISNKIEKIVISSAFEKEKNFTRIIYKLLPLRIEIVALRDFYASIFQKIPFGEIDERWFIREIKANHKIYDVLKRAAGIVISPILIIIFSPVLLAGAILVKLSSKGPVFFTQERIGKNDKPFILYKLRSMEDGKTGPLWTEENDQRVTEIGKFLRDSHLDEIPQLFNILKGNISFVGPRAERTELVNLYQKIPYYEIRHIIKPGLTGWAQINYKPSVSVEEASEKLSYDIYYIKHRSLGLDILIILKTVKLLFISPK